MYSLPPELIIDPTAVAELSRVAEALFNFRFVTFVPALVK